MSNEFQQTVNLREEMERKKEAAAGRIAPPPKPKPQPKKEPQPVRKKFIKRSREIDDVYNDQREETTRKELHKITKPLIKSSKEALYKKLVLALGVIVVLLSVYLMFFTHDKNPVVEETAGSRWYRVELINKDVYYGQIEDTSADPVVLKKVYYNYDQLNKDTPTSEEESNSLKLVKRGKEAYGPDDSMSIVRTQVVKMEELSEGSKVLKAILDYEQ